MTYALPIDEIMGNIVANVRTKITTQLIEANPDIRSLNYMIGHPLEIIQNIKELSEGKNSRRNKFPMIMLFTDIQSSSSSVKGMAEDVTLNMVIAMSTKATLKAEQRITENFKPILRPIYTALLEEMFRSGYFWIQSVRDIQGRGIERLYWGREAIKGNDGNVFNDFLDAIEIKGLKLTPTTKGSKAIGVLQTIWRTPVFQIVALPDRSANTTKKFQVGAGRFIYTEYAPGPTVTPITIDDNTAYLAGKMVEYPFFYSDTPNSMPDYDDEAGVWDESANNGFSIGAYLTIKFLDNV